MQRSPHLVTWDDADAANQPIDAGEMMRRLARVLNGDYREKQVRGEPRYEIERTYDGGFVLSILAGHIYDDRETLSLVIELRALAMARPLVSYHLSGGLERVKASHDTAWLRCRNGTIAIVGESLSGIVEIQN
jgi:hypothetical protein